MDAIPDPTIRAVAKKLKHYIDVERREEGFDRSGPQNLHGEFSSTKGGTLYYNSLQDKHLQHYFRQPLVRKQLETMGVVRPGTFDDRHTKARARGRHQTKSPDQTTRSARDESSRLTDTTAKLLLHNASHKPAESLQHSRKESYSSFTESVDQQQSLSNSSGRSTPSQASGERARNRLRSSDHSPVHPSTARSPPSSPLQSETHHVQSSTTPGPSSSYPSVSLPYPPHPAMDTTSAPHLYPPFQPSLGFPPTGYPPADPHMMAYPPRANYQHPPASVNHSLIYPPPNIHCVPPVVDAPDGGDSINVLHSHPQSNEAVGRRRLQTDSYFGKGIKMVESVGVSTVMSCDACTQTPVHAETQTDKSTLARLALKARKQKSSSSTSRSLHEVAISKSQPPVNVSPSDKPAMSESGSQDGKSEKSISEDETYTAATSTGEGIAHTFVHEVADTGNVVKLKELIGQNESVVGFTNEQGWSPLHVACVAGRNEIVQVLCMSGADLLTETPTGYTGMHFAALHGHVHCMKMLSAMNCSVSCKTVDGQTPLHFAAMSGHLECCKWLVANRAVVDAQDNNESTPCDLAKEYNHEQVVQLLRNCSEALKQSGSSISLITTPTSKSKPQKKRPTNPEEGESKGEVDPQHPSGPSLEDEWISDSEQGSRMGIQSAEQQKQRKLLEIKESQQEMYEELQTELKRGSSTFLDLAREDVESEGTSKDSTNI